MNEIERVEIRVFGRVQGVAFRWYTQQRARALGVTGWVHNQPDGSVRMIAEGTRAELELFVTWTAHGPDRARVDRQETIFSAAEGQHTDFVITG